MVCQAGSARVILAWMLVIVLNWAFIGTALAQEGQKIAEIAITGNQNINAETIRNAVSLKPGDTYTEAAVAKDRAAIMSLGYFSAVTVHTEDVAGGIKLTYEVTENPKITEIKVVGSGPVPPEKIVELMKTQVGQVLNTTTVNQDIGAIQAYYADLGYLGYVTEDIDVNPGTGVLTVPILVASVESVEISGNRKTKSYVFLREMQTQPGDYFNRKTLNEDMITIYNLDILDTTTVKQPEILPGSEMGLVKIVIPVVEKKTGQISLGFGYSSQQKLVGQARLTETNFRGKGQGLNLLWEQGASDVIGGGSSYEVGFYEPWLDKQHTSLSASAYNKILYRFSSGIFGSQEVDSKTYNERHKGGDLTLSRPLNRKTRAFLGGRFENVETDPDLLTPDLAPIVQDGNVAVGSFRMVHNTRDFDLDPATGGYEAFSFELGGVNSTQYMVTQTESGTVTTSSPFKGTFTKTAVDARRYFSRKGPKTSPEDRRVTLAMRLRAGLAGGTLPFFEQFFVGGGESLRGYREDRFWGDRMLLASIELRKPLAQAISGVLFVDYGDAWGGNTDYQVNSLPQTTGFDGHFGTGVGLRVSTPIGNLRLDYAYGDEGGRTHFSMGQAF